MQYPTEVRPFKRSGYLEREERHGATPITADGSRLNTLAIGCVLCEVALFFHIPFELTAKEDRIRTCYIQACLAYVNFDTIASVASVGRLGLSKGERKQRELSKTLSNRLIQTLPLATCNTFHTGPKVELEVSPSIARGIVGMLWGHVGTRNRRSAGRLQPPSSLCLSIAKYRWLRGKRFRRESPGFSWMSGPEIVNALGA